MATQAFLGKISLLIATTLTSWVGYSMEETQLERPTGLEWEQEQNLSYNKEPARAYFASFDTLESALKILPDASERWKCLDGNWLFNWAKNPSERPADFYKVDFDISTWAEIAVPSSWQTQGYGIPVYSNQPNIFPNNWPYVMTEPPKDWTTYLHRNPVGSYVKEIEAPKDFENQSVFLQFDGVESFFYLYVNGKYVGFSKDSRNPAAFNISKYLKSGKNKIAIEVYRNNDGSYLECQDMFRLSGIIRSVWMYSLPKIHFRDLFAVTTPVNGDKLDEAWKLHVDFDVKNDNSVYTNCEGYSAEMAVYDANQNLVTPIENNNKLLAFTTKNLRLSGLKNFKSEFIATFNKPLLWSAENPNLYTLVLSLKNEKGDIIERVSTQLGFRKVEIKNSFFYVNNQPVKLKGVNRHESTPHLGHNVPRDWQFKDIQLMKTANINHVRNSHYPTDFYFYFLCNKYGIYLQDEANIESHSYYYGDASLSHPVEWIDAHVDRIMNMVERNKNNPSIVMWSLGNEAGPGRNFAIAERTLKARDNSRPTHYERNNSIVDMGSNQYPSVEWTKWKASDSKDPRPFYISEYAHNMNNAMGNLADYQDAIESSNRILGGAIWDWVDQGLYKKLEDGTTIIGYGGDWKDAPNSGQFVMNGCIFADRLVQPGWYEIKHVFQNIKIKDLGNSKFEVFNKNYFVDLSDVSLTWDLLEDGKVIRSGDIELPEVKPMQKVQINYPPMTRQAAKPGAIYSLRFKFLLKTEKDWAPKGYVIADDQFDLKDYSRPAIITTPSQGALKMIQNGNIISFEGKNFVVSFDKATGALVGYVLNGNQLIQSPIMVNAFRTPISNDGGGLGNNWAANGLREMNQSATSFDVKEAGNGAWSIETSAVSKGATSEVIDRMGNNNTEIRKLANPINEAHTHFVVNGKWMLYADGTLSFHSALLPRGNPIELARIGYEVYLNPALSNVEYLGAGPFENYPDRKSGAFVGNYKTTVAEMFTRYARPMDCGNREDVRFVALTDNQGYGLQFGYLNNPFGFSAIPYTATDMINKNHPASLPETTDKTVLILTAATRGLGGASCGPGPIPRDIIRANKPYPLAFTIRPVTPTTQLGAIALPDNPVDQTMIAYSKKLAIKYVSSQEPSEPIENILDGNSGTIWHSQYGVTLSKYPHWFDVEVKTDKLIKGVSVLPRQDGSNGRIKNYELSISDNGTTWTTILTGELKNSNELQRIMFKSPLKTKYIQFKALNAFGGQEFASLAEFMIIE